MNTKAVKRHRLFVSVRFGMVLVALIMLIMHSTEAQQALPFYDGFNYTTGSGLGGHGAWTSGGSTEIEVNAANLTYPGLAASTGEDVTLIPNSSGGRTTVNFTALGYTAGTTVYASFLVKVNTLQSSGNKLIGYLYSSSGSSTTPDLGIWVVNSGGTAEIGIGAHSSTLSGTTGYTDTKNVGSGTHFIVVRYTFGSSSDSIDLWVDPNSSNFGAGSASSPDDATAPTETHVSNSEQYFDWSTPSGAGGSFEVDELRIGTTWAQVTPSGAAPVASQLGFTTQPANAAPGATMGPVVVQVQAAGGAAVASNNVPVTLSLTSGSGTLSGTLTQNTDASGKATFSDLSINTAGTGKQLTATASGIGAGLTGVVSSNFSIVAPSVAAKLAFTTQPANALVSATMGAVIVQIQDASSVAVASNNVPVTLTLTSGGGTLGGTTTVNSDATGKATFSTLSINATGTADQLTAAASGIGAGLANALSGVFSITNSSGGNTNLSVPVITQIQYSPTNVVLSGINGSPGSNYNVVASSILNTNVRSWVASAYANYDASGNFSITNPSSPILPVQFYQIATTVNTKLTPPSITQSPSSQTVAVGQTATLTAAADGPQLIYQWFFGGSPLPGGNNPVLTIANAQAANAGNYYVVVANGAGAATSATATLRIGNYSPTLSLQPASQTNFVGGTAIFNILADGTQPLSYQWFQNNLSTPVIGATNTTLTLNNLQVTNAGTYFVAVSGPVAPAVTSDSATLVVNTAPTALPNTNMVGFAALAGVTGGGGGSNVFTGDYLTISNYLRHTEALIINVTNLIIGPGPAVDEYCYVYGNNKTIIGIGTNAGLQGIDLRINATNIIVQNLFIPVTPGGTNDGITIDGGSKGTGKYLWIDHCTVSNAQDGSIDITKGADYVTLSWCKFIYAPKTPNFTHELVNLIGSSDTDFVNNNPFHVTIHHCWYADNAIERMPSVRHGLVHVFNCYYTSSGNNYCVRTRIGSEVLVEGNFYSGVQNPWELLTTTGATGLLLATNNNVGYLDTSYGVTWVNGWYPGQSLIPGTDTLPTLMPIPYVYTNALNTAADAGFYVPTYAGNGKYPYVQ